MRNAAGGKSRVDAIEPRLRRVREVVQKADSASNKVLTYVEYRAVSCVFQNIDPHPLSTQSVSSPPAPKAGVHTRRAVRGVGGQYFKDARHRIGLLSIISLRFKVNFFDDLLWGQIE